jgi:hypothetical protein
MPFFEVPPPELPKTAQIYVEQSDGSIRLVQGELPVNNSPEEANLRFQQLKAAVDSWYADKRNAQDRLTKRIWSYYDGKPMYSRKLNWDSKGSYYSGS